MGAVAHLWVEGVDFDATVFDTADLSTIRGGSLALIALPDAIHAALSQQKALRCQLIFSGASQAAFRIEGERSDVERDVAVAMASLGADGSPYAHMSVVHGMRFVQGSEDAALVAAQAAARSHQQRKISVPPFAAPAVQACDLDGRRPASRPIQRGEKTLKVSEAVDARRQFGRRERQHLYRRELGDRLDGLVGDQMSGFADSFEDIVRDPPGWVTASARNKIAVIYADGNGFSDRLEARASGCGSRVEALRGFSEDIKRLHRDSILPAIIESSSLDGGSRVRVETLVWGGDELLIVCPSWRALDLTAKLSGALGEASPPGSEQALSYAVGAVIANYKTPIQSLVGAAVDLVSHAKELSRDETVLLIDVLESFEAPVDGLVPGRSRILGTTTPEAAAAIALRGSRLAETVSRLRTILQNTPASQLHRWIRWARQHQQFAAAADDASLVAEIEAYASSQGLPELPGQLRLEGGETGRTLAWDLLLIGMLKDYVAPPLQGSASVG